MREASADPCERWPGDYCPSKGNLCREISVEDIVEIYNLREVIEGLAARLAAPLTDQDTS